jgi:hypothetical protein
VTERCNAYGLRSKEKEEGRPKKKKPSAVEIFFLSEIPITRNPAKIPVIAPFQRIKKYSYLPK